MKLGVCLYKPSGKKEGSPVGFLAITDRDATEGWFAV